MLRKLIQTLKRLFKKFKKLSIWFRLTMIFLVILITFVVANKYVPQKENFTQKNYSCTIMKVIHSPGYNAHYGSLNKKPVCMVIF